MSYLTGRRVKNQWEKVTLTVQVIEDIPDTVTVTKQKLNQKDEKFDVEFVNDGPKKLAARRKLMAKLEDLQEVQADKEKKADFKKRTADVKHPLVEKMFREYAPKYAKRAEELGQKGGYTRIIKLGAHGEVKVIRK